MLEFGKRYTWDVIISTYPNKYVFITDIETDDRDRIICATFLYNATFEARNEVAQKLIDNKLKGSCFWTIGPTDKERFGFTLINALNIS